MGPAIDPYGGFVHSLSDPRSDDFGPRDEPRRFYTPQVAIALPAARCNAVHGCTREPLHLGSCEVDPSETLTLATLCPRCGRWVDDMTLHTDDCDLDLLDPEIAF